MASLFFSANCFTNGSIVAMSVSIWSGLLLISSLLKVDFTAVAKLSTLNSTSDSIWLKLLVCFSTISNSFSFASFPIIILLCNRLMLPTITERRMQKKAMVSIILFLIFPIFSPLFLFLIHYYIYRRLSGNFYISKACKYARFIYFILFHRLSLHRVFRLFLD